MRGRTVRMLTESTRLRGRQSSLRAYYALKSLREGQFLRRLQPLAQCRE